MRLALLVRGAGRAGVLHRAAGETAAERIDAMLGSFYWDGSTCPKCGSPHVGQDYWTGGKRCGDCKHKWAEEQKSDAPPEPPQVAVSPKGRVRVFWSRDKRRKG